MKPNKFLNINTAVTCIFIIFAYWILAVKNGFMLRWYDEMSLFEPTGIFFRQFLYYPGGLLRYAGVWLTQLLFYPWLGTSVFIVLWLLLAWLTRRAFSLSKEAAPLALLIPLTLLVSVVQLDEAWLSIKSVGYVYFNTLGFLVSVCLFILFKTVRDNRMLAAIAGVCIVFFYTIAGFYALLSAFLCVILKISDGIRKGGYADYVIAALILATGIVIPQLYYTYLPGNTVDNDYLYLKGLPELMMESVDLYLWMPFIVSVAVTILLEIFNACAFRPAGKIMRWVSVAAVLIVACWSLKAEKKSEQLRATVLMVQSIDRGDWQRVMGIMSLLKESPNYSMLVLHNLANVNLGGEDMDLSGFAPVNIDQRHAEMFTMTAFVQVPANYHVGRFNQSYRWAMEHTVQYGKRVFFLKYMVKDALMNGEIKLAKRYNDILLHTMFHRKWAEEMNRYIEDPSLIGQNPEFLNVQIANVNSQNTN